ncbi:trehalose-phosphatase [Cereibacter johrii]|uniref:Trehalose 6-phosphate phosphatase n=1 Tax=Cereibacter johrii TaxID=445629 RepID=A0ABX5J9F7_9RHOB|nr:trehalose-phosphatase [Cereibacter johrii]QCP86714.1 trehalose-phosphatase [Cereibacter sphaeroides]MEA5159605.1 trehalose-phosphatase [Cereibacter johrii]ODM42944.1 trehalose-phosphatase [Cereibacter johrii]PTM79424.1 trehalose 6-phosphatase [Cereibacter johrii]RAZ86159.1 trehalose-phosphatase [Cereibacter johrii]
MHQPALHPDQDDGAAALRSALRDAPDDWALFLDIDGTLVDIAEQPHDVRVAAGLPQDLARLAERLGGALALVTGRRVDWIDANFGPHLFPAAGLHGVERRRASGELDRAGLAPSLNALRKDLGRRTARMPGVLLEDKVAAVALHYRQAPEREPDVRAMMEMALKVMGDGWVLQHGKMVVELRPASANKGTALEAFLAEPPFAGRRPVAVGDDVTDEEMFRVVNARGGLSVRICETEAPTLARARLASPQALRDLVVELGA